MSQIISTKSSTLGRGLCIITGASKGLGRALAQQMPPFLQPGSALLLVARSGALLKELKEELQSCWAARGLVVHCLAADLSTKDGVNETIRVAKLGAVNDLDHILLINNAGSLGDASRFAQSFIDLDEASPNKVLYCTGKAAREMMFRVLAEEEPHIRVLSYSPGPMDTEMQEQIQRLTGGLLYPLLTCQESAAKLMKLLLDDEFASGTHLDYFDI